MSEERPEGAQGGSDSGFTPPQTQEEFNRMIAPRIERVKAQFADYGELKSKAEQFDQMRQASKSEQEQLTEQLTALRTQFEQQQAESKRLSVIAKHGIPTDYQELIIGADEAELEARAEKVKALIASKTDPFPAKADPSQGAGGGGGKKTTAQQFAEFAEAAFKS